EERVRARSQREQILAWVASARFSGDARLRHDGGDPPPRQSAAAKKNETPNRGKNKSISSPSLIRWSIQEVRRIATRLARKHIQPAHIIAWSLWRRAHQALAQRAHFKAKSNCNANLTLDTYPVVVPSRGVPSPAALISAFMVRRSVAISRRFAIASAV